ncbi:helix-turn-helix domain-containing protein [Xenophilus azovorans]|uniref:helix-turn-helix domain-containing protein n=1 Tax=Xenophilus azovorans TaxID=151755 RepID=UPI00056DE18B|nr:helix-turn-helix domain-containing protein [Xenophilus azovorans]
MARAIPNYALYGDQARPAWLSTFDFEWIPQRSKPYNWDIQPHTHDAFVQVLMLTSGGGTVHLDHARIEMASPCLIVVPAQTVHGFRFTPDTNGPVITAAQRPLESLAALVMPELVQTVRTPRVTPLAPEGLEQLMPLFLAVEREHRQGDTGHVAAALALLTALAVQIARLQREGPAAPGHPLTRKAEQIEAFRRTVDERFREHLPVTAYAAALGVTAGQLTRLCQEVLGMSSLDVINARVVHEAQRELVYTVSSIKQVAARLGFVDEAYFGRFFRKHTGVTPTAFRDSALRALQDGGRGEFAAHD